MIITQNQQILKMPVGFTDIQSILIIHSLYLRILLLTEIYL